MEKTVHEDLGLSFGPNKLKRPANFLYSDAAGIWNSSSMGIRMFPFTASQWQELQRQALIYKHIMASVPVPQDLLLPSAAKSFPEAPTIFLPPTTTMFVGRGGGGLNLRFANSTDPEPGRCRRTDGKKWRCARDAASEQKYCERHLHRGRPRSRKPVEQRKSRGKSNIVIASSPAAVDAADGVVANNSIELNLPFKSMEANEETRCQDWMKSYSENLASNKQWEIMHSKIGSKYDTNPDMQHYEELPNLNYTDTNNHWSPFLNHNLPSLDETSFADYREPPRRFIDAWSSENIATATANNPNESSVSSSDKLPLSTLSLSMSNAHEGKSQPLNWMVPNSPLGGPLAEVLQSSNISSPHNSTELINLMCKSCGSHEASPRDSPSRLVSSPSGVLHKALVSLSDSSSSSSPTFAAASRSDFAFQWMNLNK